ncbi:MAG TPA: hypothetical protein VMV29_08890 [Ktedonobacterales bacterium]|nr:hypothetical protein [Ktedonobacterales bacterium]
MSDDTFDAGVDTALREGRAFIDRHPELQEPENGRIATFAGLTWGVFRAIYECDDCPGVYRVPVRNHPDGEAITCPSCGGVWIRRGADETATTPEAPSVAKRKRKRKQTNA